MAWINTGDLYQASPTRNVNNVGTLAQLLYTVDQRFILDIPVLSTSKDNLN
jgi:hypothetical protein